jgi:hypothetical protein
MAPKPAHLSFSPDAPVEDWGFDGLLEVVERGDRSHWHCITLALEADPQGKVAEEMEEVLEAVKDSDIADQFRLVHFSALAHAQAAERAHAMSRLQAALKLSGLTPAGFAARLGVTERRLAINLDGTRTPPQALIDRAETEAARASVRS